MKIVIVFQLVSRLNAIRDAHLGDHVTFDPQMIRQKIFL